MATTGDKHKLWRDKNPDKIRAWREAAKTNGGPEYQKAYRTKNKERLADYIRDYQRANPEKLKAIKARRRAARLKRTPAWVTKEEHKAITAFYSGCPEGYEVDHEVPLQGKNVSGLHVLANLQYLPISENRKKGNRFNG